MIFLYQSKSPNFRHTCSLDDTKGYHLLKSVKPEVHRVNEKPFDVNKDEITLLKKDKSSLMEQKHEA